MRFLSTEAPSLHRNYPASSVLRAPPPSQSARPVSRELPVDHGDHRWDFPCYGPLCLHAVANTPAGLIETCSLVRFHQLRPSPKSGRVGSCISRFGACSAFTHVTACIARRVANATLCTRGSSSFVASTAALIATGWSEPVPGRLLRCGPSPFFTAHPVS